MSKRVPDPHPKLTREERNRIAAEARAELGIEIGHLRFERADLRPNVKEIRQRLRLSQSEFARRFGLSVKTVQHWEQGRTRPDRPALVLLKTIEMASEVVEEAVAALARPPRAGRKSSSRAAG